MICRYTGNLTLIHLHYLIGRLSSRVHYAKLTGIGMEGMGKKLIRIVNSGGECILCAENALLFFLTESLSVHYIFYFVPSVLESGRMER